MCRAAALPASPFCPPPPSPHLSQSLRGFALEALPPTSPPVPLPHGPPGGGRWWTLARDDTQPLCGKPGRESLALGRSCPHAPPPSQAPHLPSASVSAQAWVPGPCASGLALFLQMTPGPGTLLASAAGCTLPSRGWAKMALGGFGLAPLKDKS